MVDLLFLAHNRLEMTKASFETLVRNTNWELVKTLYVMDDLSTDGTREWLYEEANLTVPAMVATAQKHFGGPVQAMNHYLDIAKPARADIMAKIDSDLVVCSGWLEHMLATINAHPSIDALGMEPGFGERVAPMNVGRTAAPARWIGGQGLIRTRVFQRRRPAMNDRWYGWTEFQRRYVKAAWITPDLPCFNLDHLPFEPWISLAARYVEQGWSRSWPVYPPEYEPYWRWWIEAAELRKMEAAGR